MSRRRWSRDRVCLAVSVSLNCSGKCPGTQLICRAAFGAPSPGGNLVINYSIPWLTLSSVSKIKGIYLDDKI